MWGSKRSEGPPKQQCNALVRASAASMRELGLTSVVGSLTGSQPASNNAMQVAWTAFEQARNALNGVVDLTGL